MYTAHFETEGLNDTVIYNQISSGKIQVPSEMMKRCGWILYTIFVYLTTIGAFGIMCGSLAYYFLEVKGAELDNTVEDDIREDIVLIFFIALTQMMVFWHGQKARRSLDSGDQERFKNFLKAFFYLIVILTFLFVVWCLINRDLFTKVIEKKQFDIEHFIIAACFVQILYLKIMEVNSRKLEQQLITYESLVRYQKTMTPIGADEVM